MLYAARVQAQQWFAPQCRRFGNQRRMHDDDGFRRLRSCGRVRRNEFWVGPFHGTARQEQFVQTDETIRVLKRTIREKVWRTEICGCGVQVALIPSMRFAYCSVNCAYHARKIR